MEPKPSACDPAQYEASLLDRVFETAEAYQRAASVEEKLSWGESCQLALRDLEQYLITGVIRQRG